MNYSEIIFFSSFILIILAILFVDLGVFSKKNHEVGFREATIWSVFWILLALAFYFVIITHGDWIHGITSKEDIQFRIDKFRHPISIDGLTYEQALRVYENNLGLEYLTGYIIEKSLSVDNLFVMVMIFFAFGVKRSLYKRVLFWGILGALVMRFIFIFGSSALIQRFEWVLYIFGALLVYTGIKMYMSRNKDESNMDVAKHPVVRFASKYFRVYPKYVGQHFFIKNRKGKFLVTPLFLVLLVIEFSDVIFAVDSIPAIFSITQDPYIVFFSNVFAILGLRSLFFLLLNVIRKFYYLKHGLSVLLTIIGIKLIFNHWLKDIGFTTVHSLYLVLGILVLSVLASLIFPPPGSKKAS